MNKITEDAPVTNCVGIAGTNDPAQAPSQREQGINNTKKNKKRKLRDILSTVKI